MRKLIKTNYAGLDRSVGWVSFQPDGSISFGLSDRTYVSPRLCVRGYIWNVYNRITTQYVVPSDPSALLPVQNPHFTFHPDVTFHLKSNSDRKAENEAIFDAIVDVGIVLNQQGEMPWIRATSAPIEDLKQPGAIRGSEIDTQDLVFNVPAIVAAASITVEIDFVRPEAILSEQPSPNSWQYEWQKVGLRIRAGYCAPQIATLSWFHSA
ncbi:hypothetical protein [Bradyrhizobium neotropicale]|uniref:Uncharacterized protein n=1 Tax=Bradyrhizobium neotropicale TaxID=1497615 RepID=A0A176ZD65_9BRAD|nr:hypothetical protein [Bradyrhizobium neotropicale]OAF17862.1 hypothetical protein AXW67_07000 [Bradyrhizobium neotropicale]